LAARQVGATVTPLTRQTVSIRKGGQRNGPVSNITTQYEKLHAGCLPSFFCCLYAVGASAIIRAGRGSYDGPMQR